MCTFNGAAYLPEQLQSIADQTRLPDELIVCDDCSSDTSADIVRRFAARAPFAVRLVANPANLGYARNFSKAIDAVQGDLILLCDQDDVWHPGKVERFARVLQERPDTGLILCDANMVDFALQPLGRTWWASREFGRGAQRRLGGPLAARLMLKNPAWVTAGAMMAFARRFRSDVLPVPQGWNHDGWIATVIAAQAPVVLIDERLNDYRQHARQVFGGSASPEQITRWARSRSASAEHFQATADRYRALQLRMRFATARPTRPPDFERWLSDKIAHWERRAQMRHIGRAEALRLLAAETLGGRYARYSQGVKSFALDAAWCALRR